MKTLQNMTKSELIQKAKIRGRLIKTYAEKVIELEKFIEAVGR